VRLFLQALSEDEIFTQSLGKNVYLSKVIAFTVGAMLAAVPGVLSAHYISYIDTMQRNRSQFDGIPMTKRV
jgi:ABC-type branched-subunit amino acid transport system permease subunit